MEKIVSKKTSKKFKFKDESTLAESVCAWLSGEGWTVYKEVKPLKLNEIADIVAIKDDKIWIIECKVNYGSKVLEQAYKWKKYADFVSIATQRTYNKNIVLDFFLKEKGIGRFWVAPSASDFVKYGYVYLDKSPILNDSIDRKIIIESLRDEQKKSIAGSVAGSVITPYKITIDQIRKLLSEKGPMSISDIVDGINHHYANRSSAINTLSKRLIDLEVDFEIIWSEGARKLFQLKKR